MAGPISHLVYADKILTRFPQKNRREFVVGTLFPDIRTLGVIDRSATHSRGIAFADIASESDSFRAGFLFHSLIDEVRHKFVIDKHIQQQLPDIYLATAALKICEDEILYNRIPDWSQYTALLSDVLPQEQQFNIPEDKLRLWHDIHIEYFTNPQLTEDNRFFSTIGLTPEQISELFSLVAQIKQLHLTDSYLNDFYDNLEEFLLTAASDQTV